ncbi:MAG: radical SAM protein [Candidatus Omnitrophota bacterium]
MAKIIFLQRLYYEYSGPMIISAVLKSKGHKVDLFIGEKSDYFIEKIKDADILAFSTMTGMHQWAIKIASEIKKDRDILTVFGGPHPTYSPELIENPAVDVVCIGEGEQAMLNIADSLDNKSDIIQIPNLWVKKDGKIYKNDIRPLVEDLDSLPFPDREIYYKYFCLRTNPHKTFMTTRGCPYQCSFCFNPKLQEMYKGKGRYIRFRNPGSVVNEIKSVKEKYGLKTVFFADDIFILDKKWLKYFIELYKKEISLPFTCDGRADILDEEVISLLKAGGCFCIRFGIESGNEHIRNKVLGKNVTNAQIVNVATILKRYGLKFLTYNMVGIPGETIENAYETVELNIKIKTNYPRCSLLTPYPGTDIANEAVNNNLLEASPQEILAFSQQFHSIVTSKYESQLLNIHSFFQMAVIFPWTWGIIKKLIKLSPNFLFNLWWSIIYFFVFVKAEGRNFLYTLVFAIRTIKVSVCQGQKK